MEHSILKSIRKVIGIHPEDDSFDEDLLLQLNGVFATLQQLGVGPDVGYMIEDDGPEWENYDVSPVILNQVKVYAFLCIRIIFDPPAAPAALDALKEQRDEKGWRLQVQAADERAVNA